MVEFFIPGLGWRTSDCGLRSIVCTSDGLFLAGKNGVQSIFSTGDRKAEIICFEQKSLVFVTSSLGYPAYYPIKPLEDKGRTVKAVLMDLDGTTVRSETFWMSIIEMTVRSLLDNQRFSFEDVDLPFVSGHSISEHLEYCVQKYCPERKLSEATTLYFQHTAREMEHIMRNEKKGAFLPNAGIRDFLLFLKSRDIKIGLVTSGLYEKAWPEILSAFRELKLGDPETFYDSIITAGARPGHGKTGTLGELEVKPHPWLYAESGVVGLGIAPDDNDTVLGIEDSGAGIVSVRLAGYRTFGLAGGNIVESGTMAFAEEYCEHFSEIEKKIRERG